VRPGAYYLRDDEIDDGLSVGLTPKDAIKCLERNYGYCALSVAKVHGLPYNLQVRGDTTDPNHAYICNLPLMTINDEMREKAMLIAGELARRSRVITCDPYNPNGCPVPADPAEDE
jgi:hypothetical protein